MSKECIHFFGPLCMLEYHKFEAYLDVYSVLFYFLARHPSVGQGLLIHEVSRSHTTTLHGR